MQNNNIKIPNNISKILYENKNSTKKSEKSIAPKTKETFNEQQQSRFNSSDFSKWYIELKKYIYEKNQDLLFNKLKKYESLILDCWDKNYNIEQTYNLIVRTK